MKVIGRGGHRVASSPAVGFGIGNSTGRRPWRCAAASSSCICRAHCASSVKEEEVFLFAVKIGTPIPSHSVRSFSVETVVVDGGRLETVAQFASRLSSRPIWVVQVGGRRASGHGQVAFSPAMFQRCWVLNMTSNCSHDASFDLSFMPNVVVFSSGYGNVPVRAVRCYLDLPFASNVVPLIAGGYDHVPVPLLAGPETVEKTVPMDQWGLLVHHAGLFVSCTARYAQAIGRVHEQVILSQWKVRSAKCVVWAGAESWHSRLEVCEVPDTVRKQLLV